MQTSSCAVDVPSATQQAGSRVMRYEQAGRWEGINTAEYKAPANHWCGILRTCGGRLALCSRRRVWIPS